MPISAIIYDVTIAVRWDEIKTNFINLLPCHVSSHSMHSTSVYALKLSVLRGTGGKALVTDHLGWLFKIYKSAFTWLAIVSFNQNKGQYFFPVSTVLFFCSSRIFLIKRSPTILRLNNSVIPNGQHGVKC